MLLLMSEQVDRMRKMLSSESKCSLEGQWTQTVQCYLMRKFPGVINSEQSAYTGLVRKVRKISTYRMLRVLNASHIPGVAHNIENIQFRHASFRTLNSIDRSHSGQA